MTAKEAYQQWMKEHGCKGQSCNGCFAGFGRVGKLEEFRCIIAEMAEALGCDTP